MPRVKTYKPDEVHQLVSDNGNLLLVHFGSTLASACEFVRQELEMLAPSYDESILKFAEVELPLQDFDLIQSYNLEEVPTLVLFAGAEEVERIERIFLPEELKEFLDLTVSFYYGQVEGREE